MAQEGDLEQVGLVNASSEPPPGLLHPIAEGDLVAIHDRGRLLHQADRALEMAYEQGVLQVGDPGTPAVMPIVDIDAGGRSAQVLFVRWPTGSDGQLPPLRSDSAERWLLVSMLLSPDRLLDVEILGGPVEKGSHLARRIDTVVAAADRARDIAPGSVFHMHDVYEEVPVDPEKPIKGKEVVARIYALSADPGGPDLSLSVIPPRRRQAAQVRGGVVIHEAGAAQADPIVVQTANPDPMTVMRAMQRGTEAGTVGVQTTAGAWSVVCGTGLLKRASASASASVGEPAPGPDEAAASGAGES